MVQPSSLPDMSSLFLGYEALVIEIFLKLQIKSSLHLKANLMLISCYIFGECEKEMFMFMCKVVIRIEWIIHENKM